MFKLSPLVRLALTGLAAGIAIVTATQHDIPTWAQAVIVGADTILAGVGIIPPHVPVTTTLVPAPTQAPIPKRAEAEAWPTAPLQNE